MYDNDEPANIEDGLNLKERIILLCLHEMQKERAGRNVSQNISTAMLYGRVVEHIDISVDEFQHILQGLIGSHDES